MTIKQIITALRTLPQKLTFQNSATSALQDTPVNKCLCCGFPKSQTTFDKMGFWESDLLALEKASENGCTHCTIIRELVELFAPDVFMECNKIKAFNDCVISVDICKGLRAREKPYLLEIFRVDESLKTPFEDAFIRSLPSSTTASEDTISTIKKWNQECQTKHSKCSVKTSFTAPSRILDLRFGNVRLRDNLREEYSYACLSHCWGVGTSIAQTTTATLEQFKNSIAWNLLTKNFQDAIDVCRRLGIDYLWIDSLCIKQDDPEDWKKEAMRMSDIYENAFLTLAATKSNSGSGGLYSKLDEEFSAFHLASRNLYIRQRPSPFPRNGTETEELNSLPLLKRGWIYQERRLSHRVVHFCSQEVVWECKTHRRSGSSCNEEDFETDGPERDVAFQSSALIQKHKDLGWKRQPPTTMQWQDTVLEYSSLNLTFDKDRLAAISGVVHRIGSSRLDDRYVAGLWEKTLLYDLEWSPGRAMVPSVNTKGRPLAFKAPSWSWASIKTAVAWPRVDAGKPEAEVVEISCPAAYIGHEHNSDHDLNPCLTLRGCLIPAKLSKSSKSHFAPSIVRAEKTADIWKCSLEFHPSHSALRDLYTNILVLADYLFHEPGPYQVEPDSEVFIMPFLARYRKAYHTALLLRQRENTSFFERIGLVTLNHREAKLPITINRPGMTPEVQVTETEDSYMRGVYGDPIEVFSSGMTNEWVSEAIDAYLRGMPKSLVRII